LASECAALADTGMVSLCTPAASAASAPRRLGTSAITVRPGRVQRVAHHLGGVGHLRQQRGGHKRADLDLAQAGGMQMRRSSAACAHRWAWWP
jgi:hypothetical protein